MTYCVHHIPGRARFRLRKVRQTGPAAAALRGRLLEMDGVRGVDISPAAGSVVVRYDPEKTSLAAISGHLGRLGYLDGEAETAQTTADSAFSGFAAQAGAMFGRALFTAVLERSINKSVTALVGGRRRR